MTSESDVDFYIDEFIESHEGASVEEFKADFTKFVEDWPLTEREINKFLKKTGKEKSRSSPSNKETIHAAELATKQSLENVNICQDPKNGWEISKTSNGFLCKALNNDYCRYIFFNYDIINGIYSWTVQVKYKKKSFFSFGSSEDSEEDLLCEIGIFPSEKKCDVVRGLKFDAKHSELRKVDSRDPNSKLCEAEFRGVEDGGEVTIEVNGDGHTMTFFIGENPLPVTITQIPAKVRIGLYGKKGYTFNAHTLRRLSAPTPFSFSSISWDDLV